MIKSPPTGSMLDVLLSRFFLPIILLVSAPVVWIAAQEPLVAPKPTEEKSSPSQAISARIPRDWLNDVELKPQSGLGVLPEENDAYYRILAHARDLEPNRLKQAELEFRLAQVDAYGERMTERIESKSEANEREQQRLLKLLEQRLQNYREKPFSYPLVRDAFNQSEACHGEVVSFYGHARKAIAFPAGENEFGIETLYQIWLFDDEAKGYPVVVITTEVPKNFPLNLPDDQVIDGVSARGYLFKLFAYEGQEGYQAVPLILAKTVSWNPPLYPKREFPTWGYGLIVLAGIVILFLILKTNRRSKHLQQVRTRVGSAEDNPFATAEDLSKETDS